MVLLKEVSHRASRHSRWTLYLMLVDEDTSSQLLRHSGMLSSINLSFISCLNEVLSQQ